MSTRQLILNFLTHFDYRIKGRFPYLEYYWQHEKLYILIGDYVNYKFEYSLENDDVYLVDTRNFPGTPYSVSEGLEKLFTLLEGDPRLNLHHRLGRLEKEIAAMRAKI